MTGTSGRAALALGNSSSPVIPGILMSDRIKMSDTPAASAIRRRAASPDCKFHREAARAQVAPEMLAEQHLDIRFIIDNEDEKIHRCVPIRSKRPRLRTHCSVRA